MHKNATKCNETLRKWCKNKHGAIKIIDTFEMYHIFIRKYQLYALKYTKQSADKKQILDCLATAQPHNWPIKHRSPTSSLVVRCDRMAVIEPRRIKLCPVNPNRTSTPPPPDYFAVSERRRPPRPSVSEEAVATARSPLPSSFFCSFRCDGGGHRAACDGPCPPRFSVDRGYMCCSLSGGVVEVLAGEPVAIRVTAATGGTEASRTRVPTAPYDASTRTLLRWEGTAARDPCPHRSCACSGGPRWDRQRPGGIICYSS
jgi:hypothetical protein